MDRRRRERDEHEPRRRGDAYAGERYRSPRRSRRNCRKKRHARSPSPGAAVTAAVGRLRPPTSPVRRRSDRIPRGRARSQSPARRRGGGGGSRSRSRSRRRSGSRSRPRRGAREHESYRARGAREHDARGHSRSQSARGNRSKKQHSRRERNRSEERERERQVEKDGSEDSSAHDDTVGSYDGKPGDYIASRYKIIREAGLGTFGRVLECLDKQRNIIVAIKVVRQVDKYSESAKIEAAILQDVNDKDEKNESLCVRMYKWFEYKDHVCMRLPSASSPSSASSYGSPNGNNAASQWPNGRQWKRRERGYSEAETGRLSLRPPACNAVKLIDFGGATYEDESKSSIINTRQYRSPEVILGLGWSYPSDIWSAGCIIAELYLGELLFATHENLEHLALIERCIGPLPAHMVAKACKQASKFFRRDKLDWPAGASSDESVEHVRKMRTLEQLVAPEDAAAGLLDLLKMMLVLDPENRATATEALNNPFFTGFSMRNIAG
ncbi:hypothetical protein PybrP1_010539 [[Pythium] brassicae (nom. inval.)]|nr:hypothetical protein PybrP1_010539 [[Pythium] brassicae (nom. inval.)]